MGRLVLLAVVVFLSLVAMEAAHVFLMRAQDDGCLYLQLPKNLVEKGRWAVERADGLTDFDHKIAVGPATLLPIALSFKFFGVCLLSARLVMFAWFLAMCVLAAAFAHRLAGPWAAVLALAGLWFTPELFLIATPAMGEVPGLVWTFAAGLFFVRWTKNEANCWFLVLAGLCAGLAYLSKSIFGYLFVPAWGLTWLVLGIRRGNLKWRELIAPLDGMAAVFVLYYMFIIREIGFSGALDYALSLRDFSHFAEGARSFSLLFYKLKLVRDWIFLPMAAAGLIYWLAAALDKKVARGHKALPLLSLVLVWILWWFFANPVNFYHHFFPAVVLMMVLCAAFSMKVAAALWESPIASKGIRYATVALLLLVFFYPWGRVRGQFINLAEQDRLRREQTEMVQFIEGLPRDDLISGWGIFHNWDFVFLTGRPTWSRPAEPTVPYREELLLMGPENIRLYDPQTMIPLSFNPHSRGCEEFVRDRCEILKQCGHFVLWRVKNASAASQAASAPSAREAR